MAVLIPEKSYSLSDKNKNSFPLFINLSCDMVFIQTSVCFLSANIL